MYIIYIFRTIVFGLCRHAYHNVSAVVRSGLLQLVGMSNFISLTGIDCSNSMSHV